MHKYSLFGLDQIVIIKLYYYIPQVMSPAAATI